MNKSIQLSKRPQGKVQLTDFAFTNTDKPIIEAGEMLLKICYVSVDPYLRGRMNEGKSYIPPFELNATIVSGIIAQVVESNIEEFHPGDYVSGMLEWKEFQKSKGEGLYKVHPNHAPLPAFLGVLGMTGLTAYFGLSEIAKPRKGETLVVSGAAGAVGSIVGQIGKILGCHVVGIAGSDEKVELLKSKFHFDEAINYKTTPNMVEAIAKACPNGVDIYFDNVGGSISDAVFFNINKFSRLVICGAISIYNATSLPKSVSVQPFLVKNSALMQGFIVSNYAAQFPEGIKQLALWLREGKISYNETIIEGFENIPQAFIDLFEGKNTGKMIVKI